ncbi:dTDP-glucose 4,6-dehydratase [bacterium]|nr:dTDP-glucose 4,6-dehydratase [bacterium]MBU0899526.1 dTDP-glucose 4,6-dehydratase [bacterium]MBU1153010.1 dTDP-glucose 4,6-dehydratase [bacterium]
MKILVTGGAGFIGSNFIIYLLNKYPDYKITNLDALTYASNLDNLAEVETCPNYEFARGDITDQRLVDKILKDKEIEVIINFAAESHVDRSIEEAEVFIRTNVLGTQVLLSSAKRQGIRRFIQISTDEVYGSLGSTGYFTESTPLSPNSPYSASKAGADLLVLAFWHTHKFPGIITRCSNNYGFYQFPEKLIPLMILNALEDKFLPVYGDGLNVRDWIYVEDHCRGIDLVLHKGQEGEVYNFGGNSEKTNLETVKTILQLLNKPENLVKYIKDRPGHDRRYAIDFTKAEKELGWRPQYSFQEGIKMTTEWYVKNSKWVYRVKSKEYLEYYEKMYGNKVNP